MGTDRDYNRDILQQSARRQFHVLADGSRNNWVNLKRMAQTKILILLFFDLLGISVTLDGIVNTVNDVKSLVVMIVGTIYLMARGYYSLRRQSIRLRKEEWEQEQREKSSL